VSDVHPIAFETNTYPLENEFYGPYHRRKIILYVKLSALELPTPVRKRLINIAKHRELYKPAKDLLVIKSQSRRTKNGNKQHVVNILRELLSEAWKADLNYLPPPDELLPHQQIELEIAEKARRAEKERLDSFENIKQKHSWTIFRYMNIPSAEELNDMYLESKKALESGMHEINELIN